MVERVGLEPHVLEPNNAAPQRHPQLVAGHIHNVLPEQALQHRGEQRFEHHPGQMSPPNTGLDPPTTTLALVPTATLNASRKHTRYAKMASPAVDTVLPFPPREWTVWGSGPRREGSR